MHIRTIRRTTGGEKRTSSFHLLTNIQTFNYSFAPEMTIDMSKNVGRDFVLQNYTLTGTKVSLVKIRGEQMVRQYSDQGLGSKSS